MNTWDYIERLRALNGGCTDYRISQLLGITRSSISYYRDGREADDEVGATIALILGLPPARVIADIRLSRALADGNERMASVWQSVITAFSPPVLPRGPRPATIAAQAGIAQSVERLIRKIDNKNNYLARQALAFI